MFAIFKGKDLLVFIFDHQHAQAIGLPTKVLHYSLLALLSLTIVAALKAVGMILVISMLIAPGATAFMLTSRFQTMVGLALLISVTNAFLGMYLSFFIDSAPGPTIILLLTINFIGVFTYTAIKNRYIEQKNIKITVTHDDQQSNLILSIYAHLMETTTVSQRSTEQHYRCCCLADLQITK